MLATLGRMKAHDGVYSDSQLGEFLRARRQLIDPKSHGVPMTGDRRVSGLRREEVAELAAVSADYYRRLEQGRERHPSAQVLRALAKALQLDEHATRHLFNLAGPTPSEGTASSARVSEAVRLLIDECVSVPAMVVGPASDILAINPLAEALYNSFYRLENLAKMVFLEPAARRFYVDWDRVARISVANLRAASTDFPHAAEVTSRIGEITTQSREFSTLWANHEVRPRVESEHTFHHDALGDIQVKFEALTIAGVPAQRLYVYIPAERSQREELQKFMADEAWRRGPA